MSVAASSPKKTLRLLMPFDIARSTTFAEGSTPRWRIPFAFITMERKYKLKPNALVYFNHAHYTVANITDNVAIEMVKANSGHSRSFVNGEALLAELDGGVKVQKPKNKGGRPPKVVLSTETIQE